MRVNILITQPVIFIQTILDELLNKNDYINLYPNLKGIYIHDEVSNVTNGQWHYIIAYDEKQWNRWITSLDEDELVMTDIEFKEYLKEYRGKISFTKLGLV